MPKTLEELFVKKYERLEIENKELTRLNDYFIEENSNQKEEIKKLKAKYDELIKQLKEDFDVQFKKDSGGKPFIKLEHNYIWPEWEEEKYNYYKNLFNLKEEGEEDNEQ